MLVALYVASCLIYEVITLQMPIRSWNSRVWRDTSSGGAGRGLEVQLLEPARL